jgi:flagellar hook-associated protein 3 FlgL
MIGRVTQNALVRVLGSNVARLQSELVRTQGVVSSQKRLQTASDDPVGTALVNDLRAETQRLQSFLGGVGFGRSVLGAEDAALNDAHAIMTRAREIAVQFANDTTGTAGRVTAAEEVEELERALLSLGNTTVAGRHIFGGLARGASPFAAYDDPGFDPTMAYAGPPDPFTIKVGNDQTARLTTAGDQVFGAALVALDDLRQTLAAGGDPTGSIDAIGTAAEGLRQERASVGGRLARLNTRDEEIQTAIVGAQVRQGQIEDADLTAVLIELAQLQNALEVTLTAGQALLSASVLDFVRL